MHKFCPGLGLQTEHVGAVWRMSRLLSMGEERVRRGRVVRRVRVRCIANVMMGWWWKLGMEMD